MRRGRPPNDDILTPREWEVLALIEEGLTNEQIAARLSINVGTAKYHVAEILSKLQVHSRSEAPAAARELTKLQTRHAGVLVVLLRLKPSWPVASVLGSLLIVVLVAFLMLRVFGDDKPPLRLESPGGFVEGIGLDAGPSATPGAASQLAPPNCVSGPRAENPTQQSPSGSTLTMPTNERFTSVEDAEAWICLDVPQADLLFGWPITDVTAHRSHSLSQFIGGMGHRRIEVTYIRAPAMLRVMLTTPGEAEIVGAGERSKTAIGNGPATLWTKDAALTVQWQVNGVTLYATITSASATALREAMPLLESIR